MHYAHAKVDGCSLPLLVNVPFYLVLLVLDMKSEVLLDKCIPLRLLEGFLYWYQSLHPMEWTPLGWCLAESTTVVVAKLTYIR